jgi:predicted N-acetyltransferase YhbS
LAGGFSLIIRQEKTADYSEVYELVKTSFATAAHADGTEADYLNDIRKRDTFIPQLSLVAEAECGKIIGQIVLYTTLIATPAKAITELVLSPICVHPVYFRRGIARALMERAFKIARDMGYKAVFLCGAPEIYSRLGFVPSFAYSIYHINDAEKNAAWCMAHELTTGSLTDVSGTVNIL